MMAAMRTSSFFVISLLALGAGSSLGCGPSRLSDADITRLCELQVRCSGGSQASCEASTQADRDATNAAGCGGQLGALARCVIRADECTVPASCEDEQMRLSTCLSRPRTDAGATTPDARTTFPDTGGSCPPQSFEEGFEACTDGCDNDGDIGFDCNDEGCCGSVECGAGTLCGGGSCSPVPETSYDACTDGCDNDGDTVFDCNDDGRARSAPPPPPRRPPKRVSRRAPTAATTTATSASTATTPLAARRSQGAAPRAPCAAARRSRASCG